MEACIHCFGKSLSTDHMPGVNKRKQTFFFMRLQSRGGNKRKEKCIGRVEGQQSGAENRRCPGQVVREGLGRVAVSPGLFLTCKMRALIVPVSGF